MNMNSDFSHEISLTKHFKLKKRQIKTKSLTWRENNKSFYHCSESQYKSKSYKPAPCRFGLEKKKN